MNAATLPEFSILLQRIPLYFTENIISKKPSYTLPAGMFRVSVPDYYLKGEGEAGRVGYRMLLWATACVRIP